MDVQRANKRVACKRKKLPNCQTSQNPEGPNQTETPQHKGVTAISESLSLALPISPFQLPFSVARLRPRHKIGVVILFFFPHPLAAFPTPPSPQGEHTGEQTIVKEPAVSPVPIVSNTAGDPPFAHLSLSLRTANLYAHYSFLLPAVVTVSQFVCSTLRHQEADFLHTLLLNSTSIGPLRCPSRHTRET